MLIFIQRAFSCFKMFCLMAIPLGNGGSIKVYEIIVGALGFILAFKFIRGLFF